LEARLDVVEGILGPDLSTLYSFLPLELVQSEDKFTKIKDALKPLCKVDLDKLISAVRFRIEPHSFHYTERGIAGFE
jgi:hypothetical protein